MNTITTKEKELVAIIGAATIVLFLLLSFQQQQIASGQRDNQETREALRGIVPKIAPDGTFQNIEDGIRLKVPKGWAVNDVDNADPLIMAGEQILGFGPLAAVCSEHIPDLGGTRECNFTPPGSHEVNILRVQNLRQLPEVQNLILSQNKTITIQDFMIIYQENIVGTAERADPSRSGSTQETTPIKQTPMQINATNAEGDTAK